MDEDSFDIVYDDLRRAAASLLRRRPPGQSLGPTDLVHEASLRLMNAESACTDPEHALRLYLRAMEFILADRARARRALKRGGNQTRRSLHDQEIASPPLPDMLDLCEALDALELLDARAARVFRLCDVYGFGADEVATSLAVSTKTVSRDRVWSRAWLRSRLASS